jgi:hypothetical protein
MPVYNLSALVDRTRYLEAQGLSSQEAEAKSFAEFGLTNDTMTSEIRAEYDRLLADPTADSEFARNDRESLLNANEVTQKAKYDLNAGTTVTSPQEAGEGTDGTIS